MCERETEKRNAGRNIRQGTKECAKQIIKNTVPSQSNWGVCGFCQASRTHTPDSLKDIPVLHPQRDGSEVAARYIHHPFQQQEETAKVDPCERHVQKLAQCCHLRSRDMMRTSKLLHTNEPSQRSTYVVVLMHG